MTPNEATESSLDHVNAFFAAAPPAVLALERARQIATHVGRCAPCAELLAEHHEHRELLLDVLQTEGDKPPEASDVDPVAAAQQELELWARRVLEQASPEVKAGLERLPAPSKRALAELRTLPSLPPALYRIALAMAEVTLGLQSLVLRSPERRATLLLEGSLKVGGNRIPSTYLATRIAERAGMPIELGASVWAIIAGLAIRGQTGLPRLAAVEYSSTSVLLEFDQDAHSGHLREAHAALSVIRGAL